MKGVWRTMSGHAHAKFRTVAGACKSDKSIHVCNHVAMPLQMTGAYSLYDKTSLHV